MRFLVIRFLLAVLVVFSFHSTLLFAEAPDPADSGHNELGLRTGETYSAGIVVGAMTVEGQNYQQIGFRADIPFGKLGFGLDIQILLDEEGSIREEDWDDWEDYVDMIHYIRWAEKGDPFYVKVGGLDYSYIGYSNVINGYSNTIEYPDYKHMGMEMAVETERFEWELLLNDYKELDNEKPSMVVGTRLAFRPIKKFEIGASVAADLNEYNGLRDSDGDGYPDEIDEYPYDETIVTEKERLEDQVGLLQPTIDDLILHGELKDIDREDLTSYSDMKSDLVIWSVDAGIPVVEGDTFALDIYSAYTDIVDYGWGVTVPGVRAMFGDMFTVVAEYRMQSEEFLYGYFNHTYELERAQYVTNSEGIKTVRTKQETLLDITEEMDGYLAGLSINLYNFVLLMGQYQDMTGDFTERKSVNGEIILNDNAFTAFPSAKGYYVQNNVESLSEWRTPSTVTGVIITYNLGGTAIGFDTRYTFVDQNGDGEISGSDETIKTISVSSTVTF